MEENIKKSVRPILILWVISALCYLPLIARGLTNSVDGLWATSYYQSGNWELSIGRWAWLFLDKAREGYGAEPFNSLLTLLLLSIAAYISVKMFTGSKYKAYIYAMLMLCSVTVCCYLSYRYMSPTFGLSVLLSVIAASLIAKETQTIKQEIMYLAIVTALLVISLGLYQANIGCFCVVVILAMMKLVMNDNKKQSLRIFVKSMIAGAVGCVLYKIAWDICLKLRHTAPSSYKGANSLSVGEIIINIPLSLEKIYSTWVRHFSFAKGNYIFHPIRIVLAVAVLALVLFVGIKAARKNIINLILYIVLCLVIPVGANLAVLLAPKSGAVLTQMTMPMAMVLPLFLCFIEGAGFKTEKLLGVLGALLLYGNVYAVGADIDAMAQGSTTCYAIMNSVMNTLNETDLFSHDYQYIFCGDMSANELFNANEMYYKANSYAKFGTLMTNPDMMRNAYVGLLDDIGIKLRVADYPVCLQVYDSGILDNMPAYPAEGSIVEQNGYVIIKISENYKYN